MIRYHRKRAGLTRVQLADLCGIGKTALFDIENGKATVRLSTLTAVLAGLNITPIWSSPLMEEFREVDDA
jgi:HTH-type transcriptional regulator / antitoxin HipB